MRLWFKLCIGEEYSFCRYIDSTIYRQGHYRSAGYFTDYEHAKKVFERHYENMFSCVWMKIFVNKVITSGTSEINNSIYTIFLILMDPYTTWNRYQSFENDIPLTPLFFIEQTKPSEREKVFLVQKMSFFVSSSFCQRQTSLYQRSHNIRKRNFSINTSDWQYILLWKGMQ